MMYRSSANRKHQPYHLPPTTYHPPTSHHLPPVIPLHLPNPDIAVANRVSVILKCEWPPRHLRRVRQDAAVSGRAPEWRGVVHEDTVVQHRDDRGLFELPFW